MKAIISVSACCLLILGWGLPAQDTWELITTSGDVPGPRIGHSLVNIGNTLYLYGGSDSTKGSFSTIHTFNYNQKEWTEEDDPATIPPARQYHRAIVKDSRMYVFFGSGTNGVLADIWEYDPQTHLWNVIVPAGALQPVARQQHAAVLSGNTVYISGGLDANGNALSDCWAYRFATNTWQRYADIPTGAIYGHTAAFDQGKLYLYGGFRSGGLLTPLIDVYHTGSASWSSQMPGGSFYPTSNAASVQQGNKVYIFGGYSGYYEPYGYCWDLATHQFTALAEGPELAGWHGAYLSGIPLDKDSMLYDQVILFGGRDSTGISGSTWQYTTTTGIPVPLAEWSADTMEVRRGDTVRYWSLSGGGDLTLSWSFEGGVPSSGSDSLMEVVYPEAGRYKVTLAVENTFGLRDSMVLHDITVWDDLWGQVVMSSDSSIAVKGALVLVNGQGVIDTLTSNARGYFGTGWPAGDTVLLLSLPDLSVPAAATNALDALQVARHQAGLATLDPLSLHSADVDGNGMADTADAVTILLRFTDHLQGFPSGPWRSETTAVPLNASGIQQYIRVQPTGDVNRSWKPGP